MLRKRPLKKRPQKQWGEPIAEVLADPVLRKEYLSLLHEYTPEQAAKAVLSRRRKPKP